MSTAAYMRRFERQSFRRLLRISRRRLPWPEATPRREIPLRDTPLPAICQAVKLRISAPSSMDPEIWRYFLPMKHGEFRNIKA